ncbi:MAG: twin-arginine translocase TatA/TatE family subunit [Pseudomonadota bacterium]|nr:twin-arginine translocase TatA/TatE family subunit [Pseudomonadota bacterium]
MFGVGLLELGLIMVVALLVVGPRHMPEALRMLGQTVRSVQAFWADIKNALNAEPETLEGPQMEPLDKKKDGEEKPL